MAEQVREATRHWIQRTCDQCDIRESHFYDSAPWVSPPIEWAHEWITASELPIRGEPSTYCSPRCLDARLTEILSRTTRVASYVALP